MHRNHGNALNGQRDNHLGSAIRHDHNPHPGDTGFVRNRLSGGVSEGRLVREYTTNQKQGAGARAPPLPDKSMAESESGVSG